MATNLLNQENIIKKVYDPPTQSLKVTGTSTVVPGQMEVSISADEDSIKVGDGQGDFLAINPDGSINVNANLINGGVGTPTIFNLPALSNSTEYSYAFPVQTKRFKIRARGNAKLQFSYIMGNSNTNFITIPPGNSYEETGISGAITIYIRTNKPNETIEIISWE